MNSVLTVSYLTSGVLFILSLGGLSNQETARRGNLFGIIGIALAVVTTLFTLEREVLMIVVGTILVGSAIGARVAAKVEMTAMPELVAVLHSFVGLAAVFVGISGFWDGQGELVGTERIIHEIEIFLGVFIGAITFTGSIVAFGKLKGSVSSKSLMLPGRHFLNLVMITTCLVLGYLFMSSEHVEALWFLLIMTGVACVIGVHLVMAIGGADMPVVVSMLNSYSGWAAAATGFMLNNDLLIVTGALVGSSGAILSYIMCRAMNRSFISVIAGGFGAGEGAPASAKKDTGTRADFQAIEVADTVELLKDAKEVIIVPGYGLAVARAQHPLWEASKILKANGTNVRFAIHPVAGRLPGHMNVLLAEAQVPYDIVLEMDEINEDFPKTDVVLIIGANDIVNPGAQDDESSPIYGMPVLEAWKAKTCVILKRSMGTGYSGVDNPIFYNDNSRMLFGDAKASIDKILMGLQS